MKNLVLLLLLGCQSMWSFAQCNPQDQVESWYDWFKDLENSALDYLPISDELEQKIGLNLHKEISTSNKILTDHPKKALVEEVMRKLTAHTDRKDMAYQIYIMKDDENPNAFSIAGGQLYITTKMLEWIQSEDELAFILGHEIAHVDHKHSIRKVQKMKLGESLVNEYLGHEEYGTLVANLANIITSPFGQIDEYDADRAGAILAHKAGYSPRNGMKFLDRLSEKESYNYLEKIIRTHPYSKERAICLDSFISNELNK